MGNAALKSSSDPAHGAPGELPAGAIHGQGATQTRDAGPSYESYDEAELVAMVRALLRKNSPGVEELQRAFGEHMLRYCAQCYPDYFESAGLFDFLTDVQSRVHADIRHVYPDAELPSFECHEENEAHLVITVYAPAGSAAFAEGLISGCARYYDEDITLSKTDLSGGDGTEFQIVVERTD